MKGRKRKPYSIAQAEGFKGHRDHPAPVSVKGDFEPPFELGQIARAEWGRIRLEARWIEAPSALILAERCRAFEQMQEAYADLKKRGQLIKTRNGNVKNPSLQIIRECRQFILRADTELALTTCSQQKIPDKNRPPVDPLEAKLCG